MTIVADVCALVVTYNRKTLLLECLEHLRAQSLPIRALLLVDNASSDGTPAELARAGYLPADLADLTAGTSLDVPAASDRPTLHYRRLDRNIGGAGGWHVGLREVAALGHEWAWIMDDDTMPSPMALEELLAARARFSENRQPEILASKVVWTDGSLHVMNFSNTPPRQPADAFLAAEQATVALRASSFVSLLLHVPLIGRYGLPIAGYFLWNDDTEYTARILCQEFGVAVPHSVVLHKTATNHDPLASSEGRFFFHVRNTLWMLWHTDSFQGPERVRGTIGLFWRIGQYLHRNKYRPAALWTVLRGLVMAMCSTPVLVCP